MSNTFHTPISLPKKRGKQRLLCVLSLAGMFAIPMEGIQAQRGRSMHQAVPAPEILERVLKKLTPIQIEEFQEAYRKMPKGGANARGLNVLRNKRKRNLSSDIMKIKAHTEKGALLYQLLYGSKSAKNIEAIFKVLGDLPIETMYEASLESHPPKAQKLSLSKTEKRRAYEKRKEEERRAKEEEQRAVYEKTRAVHTHAPAVKDIQQKHDRHAHLDLAR